MAINKLKISIPYCQTYDLIHNMHINFLQVMKYEPLIAWLPGLANPRSYLLTVLQSACRKYHWPIEQAGLVAQITNAKHLPAPRDVRNFPLHYRLANALTSIFALSRRVFT